MPFWNAFGIPGGGQGQGGSIYDVMRNRQMGGPSQTGMNPNMPDQYTQNWMRGQGSPAASMTGPGRGLGPSMGQRLGQGIGQIMRRRGMGGMKPGQDPRMMGQRMSDIVSNYMRQRQQQGPRMTEMPIRGPRPSGGIAPWKGKGMPRANRPGGRYEGPDSEGNKFQRPMPQLDMRNKFFQNEGRARGPMMPSRAMPQQPMMPPTGGQNVMPQPFPNRPQGYPMGRMY